MNHLLNGNIFMSCDFGAEKDAKYPGLNRNQNKPLYGKFSVFKYRFYIIRL
jgi:hypothetical protein